VEELLCRFLVFREPVLYRSDPTIVMQRQLRQTGDDEVARRVSEALEHLFTVQEIRILLDVQEQAQKRIVCSLDGVDILEELADPRHHRAQGLTVEFSAGDSLNVFSCSWRMVLVDAGIVRLRFYLQVLQLGLEIDFGFVELR
jgi:hypothetical protein